MNRRGFLKFLGIGTAAVVLSPNILANTAKPSLPSGEALQTYLTKWYQTAKYMAYQQKIASDTADRMLESIKPIGKEIANRVADNNKPTGLVVKDAISRWFDRECKV